MAARARLARARTEPRLDPVHWRRPGAGLLIRLSVVATLLSVAALIAWAEPQESGTRSASPCLPVPGPTSGSPDPASSPTDGREPAPASTDGGHPAPTAAHGRDSAPTAGGRDSVPAVPPGSVGVPVRLAEPTALALVRPGDRIDLLRIDDAGHGTPVAAAALVLDVTGTDDPTAGGLLVALRPADAERAVAAQGRGFAILIHPS